MALRLASGSVTPFEHPEEPVGRLHVDQVHVELAPERLLHLLGLARAHEPGVDEDTGELVADGPVDERGGHRRVDPARQGAQHPGAAHLGPHRLHRRLDDVGVGPLGRGPAHVEQEPLEELLARARCAPPRDGTARRRSAARRRPSAATGASGVDAVGHEAGRDLGDRVARGSSTRRRSRGRASRRTAARSPCG